MVASGTCWGVATCLLLTACSAYAGPPAKAREFRNRGTAGQSLLSWFGKQLPELSLRAVACVKKHEREGREVLLSVFSDAAKCFDETRGSLLYAAECMLRNGVPHMLNALATTHKLAGCIYKNKQEGRLCISVTDIRDQTCPFAVGL